MRFRYLIDPLFLFCLGLYAANRWIFEPYLANSFFKCYLNDLICIPFCVPIMLFLMRKLRLRAIDEPPQAHEILIPLLLWAFMFELWLPNLPLFRGKVIADPQDILCYSIGSLIAGLWWKWYYREKTRSRDIARKCAE